MTIYDYEKAIENLKENIEMLIDTFGLRVLDRITEIIRLKKLLSNKRDK